MTAHRDIREAAAVAVPDAKYGEVVGAWIVREPHSSISREEARRVVVDGMNPQVSVPPVAVRASVLGGPLTVCMITRTPRRGFGFWARMAWLRSCPRRLAERYRSTSYGRGLRSLRRRELGGSRRRRKEVGEDAWIQDILTVRVDASHYGAWICGCSRILPLEMDGRNDVGGGHARPTIPRGDSAALGERG